MKNLVRFAVLGLITLSMFGCAHSQNKARVYLYPDENGEVAIISCNDFYADSMLVICETEKGEELQLLWEKVNNVDNILRK
ncbi:MAG: hypothetical protein A3G49_00870 [Candidatus Sungbacteria bacterium RIFCSPLOWO2_12_FULL_41_11]|uniref:Ig-like domain-containing protein n=1 Tax=Candidatus Sungbacteria bacterium RIFCSPLOWO2_12_FULL_41_11 TaxID=1802286 RepID=A0A1G2LR64_9BACT|nr:MAG: hypothetical protein UV01_C0017G0010 [Parcubacteria group bacterium GW2011_GWA2_42_14]OGZ98260.1 MAG: hypothetical protein A3D41_03570 [Candidatus Sungbacteria bacterium RIFCSPHIGHO2_02_FULL_41_12b]OHA13362.1 MAG: hypothetical protein A3G49_00870 [Candidatus Sungbacteria bacterium RIFCSPLOWO2_12_FULL_41_11]